MRILRTPRDRQGGDWIDADVNLHKMSLQKLAGRSKADPPPSPDIVDNYTRDKLDVAGSGQTIRPHGGKHPKLPVVGTAVPKFPKKYLPGKLCETTAQGMGSSPLPRPGLGCGRHRRFGRA